MEGEICESRYCDVGTVIPEQDSSTTKVDPGRQIKKYQISEKQIPQGMDQLDLRREHMNRRQHTKPLVAQEKESRKAVKNAHISQMQLQVLLKRLQDEGVEYLSVSRYFEEILRNSSMAREVKAIISEVLVKDRDELKNSEGCYAQVIEDLRRRKLSGFAGIEPAILALRQILLPRN